MAYQRHDVNCNPVTSIASYVSHDRDCKPRADRKKFKRHNRNNEPVEGETLEPVRMLKNPTIKYLTHNGVANAKIRGSNGTFQGGSGEYLVEKVIQRRDIGTDKDWVNCIDYKATKNVTYILKEVDEGKEHRVMCRATDKQTGETEYSYSPTIST